jgi:hypothetical protein
MKELSSVAISTEYLVGKGSFALIRVAAFTGLRMHRHIQRAAVNIRPSTLFKFHEFHKQPNID